MTLSRSLAAAPAQTAAAVRTAAHAAAVPPPPAQWCLSCVHAQTRFSCKKLRNNLADRPAWSRKRIFRPQQFAHRNCVLSAQFIFTPSEAPRRSEHGHGLPSARPPLYCASQNVAARVSCGVSLATERSCRLRRRRVKSPCSQQAMKLVNNSPTDGDTVNID